MMKSKSAAAPTNRLLPGIQCFAWNGDCSRVAVCPTTNEIWIFETNGQPDVSKWTRTAVLKEHFNVISALDWHPKTNLLLSAGTDRALIVWQPGTGAEAGNFVPQMGILKEKKANLDAAWNHRGDKYCVGSSSGHVYIGTFSDEANFWVAHPLKKNPIHKASVICTRFDPLSGRVVASASLDGTILLTTCYREDADTDSAGPFGNITSFGESVLSLSSNGWINGLSFSPTNSHICYVTQDGELNFVDLSNVGKGKEKPSTVKVLHNGNPHLQVMFID